MLTANRRPRPGLTLAEMLVAITIGGVVLALVSAIAFRQQRFYASTRARLAVAAELRETAAILPIDLRGIAVGAGDIRSGEARDTSLEFRATIASAVVCEVANGRVILAPPSTSGVTFAGSLTSPQPNDTAWVLSAIDTSEIWRPHRITATNSAPAGNCTQGAPTLTGAALTAARLSLTLDSVDTIVRPGAVLRVSRPSRYSTYRSADGAWYLGLREWNPSTGQFNTIQPVTGAFLAPASGGLRFRYFDSSGAELPPGLSTTRAIALLGITVKAETKQAVELIGSRSTALMRRADSVTLAIRPRNWR
jgi:prepilin-type N-terminal cleavage/methylation domain-containing protein